MTLLLGANVWLLRASSGPFVARARAYVDAGTAQYRVKNCTLYTYLCSRWALLDDVDDYDFHSWTHAAHELLPVHHAERRVGLVLELHLVYSALLLLLLRRMTSIQSTLVVSLSGYALSYSVMRHARVVRKEM